ncbi:MAG: PAS domain S-box protein, partial [Anaerolineae bacterium]|nr:PAS domain S-box protein [Anaerolineae bacterium]
QNVLAQQQLRRERTEAQAQLYFQANILQNVRDAVIVTDLEGRIIYWNDGATNLFGYSQAEVLGHTPARLYPSQDPGQMAADFQRILEGQDFIGVWRGRHKDGRDIWIDLRTTLLRNEDGLAAGFVGVSKDVTERRQIQQALRESEASLAEAQRIAGMGSGQWDLLTGHMTWSEGFYHLLGLEPGSVEPTLENLLQFIVPEDRAIFDEPDDGFPQTAGPEFVDFRIVRADGQERLIQGQYRRILDEAGHPIRLVGVVQDVTGARQAQADLVRREREFRSLAENLPDIVARFDRHLRHLYVSPQITEVTQLPPAAFLGKTNQELGMPPELVDLWDGALHRVFERGTAEAIEFTFPPPNGEERHFASQVVPELAADGSVATVLGITRDITDYKRQTKVLRIHAQQQAVVASLGQLALSTFSLSSLMETAMAMITQTLEVEYGKVLEFLPEDEVLLLRAGEGWASERVGQVRVETDPDTQSGYTLLSEEAVIVEDYEAETRFKPSSLLIDHQVRSGLSIVIKGQQHPFGVLGAYAIKPRPFTQDDINFMKAVANILADAIQKNLLVEQIRNHTLELEQRVADRTRELTALYEITLIASQALDLPAALEQILRQSMNTIPCQAGYIGLRDETPETIQLPVWQGFPPETIFPPGVVPFLSQAEMTNTINRGQPLIKPITSASAADLMSFPSARTILGVPLRSGQVTLGVLAIIRGTGEPEFNAEEVTLMASIGDHIGLVVESAQLRQRAERAAVIEERARLARDIHDSVLQLLYSLSLFTETGYEALQLNNMDTIKNCFDELKGISDQAVKEMRLLVFELRPLMLSEQHGLIGALQHRLEAVEGRIGVDSHLHYD